MRQKVLRQFSTRIGPKVELNEFNKLGFNLLGTTSGLGAVSASWPVLFRPGSGCSTSFGVV